MMKTKADTAPKAELYHLAEQLGQALVARGWRVGCAESCTGGLVAAALTEVPGASAWFDCGLVTYSNAAKTELLGVPPKMLAEFGAVSVPVARAMAVGLLAQAPEAMLAVSITGVAGPGGGSAEKPVGTVCFGFAQRKPEAHGPDACQAMALTQHFAGKEAQTRQHIRHAAVRYALTRLRTIAQTPLGNEAHWTVLPLE